ncbi:MAG: hypothetical protein JSR34_05495 [Proteobacteria bacterium]|nr:hypothetical protein [Pseudomonadota bacterium]
MRLDPRRLLLHLREAHLLAAQREGVLDCAACGRCDAVCPSRIPLMQHFVAAKKEIAVAIAQRERALAARERYRARQLRLSHDEEVREERHHEQTANAASADAVAAAIARAQAKRAARRGTPPA